MIVLFTDFGASDIYVGQVKAVLHRESPGVEIVDLLHDAPNFSIRPAAFLLSALVGQFPPDSVFLCVIDPGVGSARAGAVMWADGKWFVGPDNGLLSVVAARASECRHWRIRWRSPELSASFHGRDLFAPVSAWLARGELPGDKLEARASLSVMLPAEDLSEIIYIDHYGNAVTGLRAPGVLTSGRLLVAGASLGYAAVFSAVTPGHAFWHHNSIGLVEIAVNQGNAARLLQLAVGTPLRVLTPPEGAGGWDVRPSADSRR